MSFSIHGLIVIPKEPELKVSQSASATYLNFKAVTEGRPQANGQPSYSYWDCNMYVPESKAKDWEASIKPGEVFYIEHGTVELVKLENLKFPITRVRLDCSKVKQMEMALWTKKE